VVTASVVSTKLSYVEPSWYWDLSGEEGKGTGRMQWPSVIFVTTATILCDGPTVQHAIRQLTPYGIDGLQIDGGGGGGCGVFYDLIDRPAARRCHDADPL